MTRVRRRVLLKKSAGDFQASLNLCDFYASRDVAKDLAEIYDNFIERGFSFAWD